MSQDFPVVRSLAGGGFTINLGGFVAGSAGGGPGQEMVAAAPPQQGYRFMSRDLYTSVNIGPSSCAIETSLYRTWPVLRAMFHQVLDALGGDLRAIAGIDRLGVRYFNEVRLAESDEAVGIEDWKDFVSGDAISANLLASRASGYAVSEAQTVTRLTSEGGYEVIVRHGPSRGAVIGEGPVKLPSPLRTGPYYLVDIDSSISAPGPLPSFDLDAALATADEVHEPVSRVFGAIVSAHGPRGSGLD